MKAKKATFNYTRLQYSSLNEIKPFKTSFTLNPVLIIDELLTATLLLKGLSKLSSVFFLIWARKIYEPDNAKRWGSNPTNVHHSTWCFRNNFNQILMKQKKKFLKLILDAEGFPILLKPATFKVAPKYNFRLKNKPTTHFPTKQQTNESSLTAVEEDS